MSGKFKESSIVKFCYRNNLACKTLLRLTAYPYDAEVHLPREVAEGHEIAVKKLSGSQKLALIESVEHSGI